MLLGDGCERAAWRAGVNAFCASRRPLTRCFDNNEAAGRKGERTRVSALDD